jgi:hypothetical protein
LVPSLPTSIDLRASFGPEGQYTTSSSPIGISHRRSESSSEDLTPLLYRIKQFGVLNSSQV